MMRKFLSPHFLLPVAACIVLAGVWGRPLGNKATLKVTKNRGTAEESTQYLTVDLTDKGGQARVQLASGRRTAAAAARPTQGSTPPAGARGPSRLGRIPRPERRSRG